MSSIADDEALARALQEQYQNEYERRASRSTGRGSTSRPTNSAARPGAAASVRDSTASDAALALRLEQEMRVEELARRDEDSRRRRQSGTADRGSRPSRDSSTPRGSRPSGEIEAVVAPTAPDQSEDTNLAVRSVRPSSRRRASSVDDRRTPSDRPTSNTPTESRGDRAVERSGQTKKKNKSSADERDRSRPHSSRENAARLATNKRSRSRPHSRSETNAKSTTAKSRPHSRNENSASSPANEIVTTSTRSKRRSSTKSSREDRNPSSPSRRASGPPLEITVYEDQEIAKRIEQEKRDEEMARNLMRSEEEIAMRTRSPVSGSVGRSTIASRSQTRSQNDTSTAPNQVTSPRSARRSTVGNDAALPNNRQEQPLLDVNASAVLARKLEQEKRDEQLARQLMLAEQQAAASRGGQVYATAGNTAVAPPRRSSFCRRAVSLIIPVIVVVAAVIGLVMVFSGGDSLPSFPGWGDSDPWDGSNPDDANRWRTNGNVGLSLEVLNALSDEWDELFDIAIVDWDSGVPDALTLRTKKIGYEAACEPVQGKMKVCNGNYGNTEWRGINQVLLSNGYIISSIAKLNEYYLNGSGEAQRRYTMCHEIGHGFGLPHTDENFYNADLGNCMDYTSNPHVNMRPDESNFEFLEDLYGTVPNRRGVRALGPQESGDLPHDLVAAYDEAAHELEIGEEEVGGWKVLHEGHHGKAFVKDLGNGYTMEARLLLAGDE